MPALEHELKARISMYLTRSVKELANAVPCYSPKVIDLKNYFVIYVGGTSREGPLGIKYGEFVLLIGRGTKDSKAGKEKYLIRFLNSNRKDATLQVLAETLFPPVFVSGEGKIPLLDISGSKVVAQSASISLNHNFKRAYEVSIQPVGARESSTFEELFLGLETPFDVFTSSLDGLLIKGVVLKFEQGLATVIFPKDKYPVSEGEIKIEKEAVISQSSATSFDRGGAMVEDAFLLPADSFRKKLLPV
jgi:hypothetical protein